MEHWSVIDEYPQIDEAWFVVGEWKVWIGSQRVSIRVIKDKDERHLSESSHYFKKHGNIGEYRSSAGPFSTVREALDHALIEKTMFYDGDDSGEWITNVDY